MVQLMTRVTAPDDSATPEQQVTLDDSSLDGLPEIPEAPGVLERLRRLEGERRAAFSQMHRMVADIGMLRSVNERWIQGQEQARIEGMYRMALLAEFRQGGSPAKVLRTGVMGALLANAIGGETAYCDRLQVALPLADIGEIGLPDSLLQAPVWGAEQRAAMQAHCAIGHALLDGSRVPEIRMAAEIALTHHERFDGRGYPQGLHGPAIPLAGRIAAVVDCFDAMTCARPDRTAVTPELALQMVAEQQGSAFDPLVIDALLGIGKVICAVRWVLDDASAQPETLACLGKPPEAGFWRRFLN